MRYDGNVRNRKFTTQEASLMVSDIWTAKTQSDQDIGARQNLSDFVYEYFKVKEDILHSLIRTKYGTYLKRIK